MSSVLQRPDWHGSPVNLGELLFLKKNRREATCQPRSHQFGWELRLLMRSRGRCPSVDHDRAGA